MQRYSGVVQDQQGNAISGAQITVYTAGVSNPLPTIYSATGSLTSPAVQNNPMTSDANGAYSFAAPNGAYDIQISGGSIPTTTIPNVILFDNLVAYPSPALGTVTSVGLSTPGIFTVSGSPVTGAGTLGFTLNNQNANLFLASPNGSNGAPTFRAIASADLPSVGSASTYGSATQVPQITTDIYGRITSVSLLTIAPTFANVTGKPTTIAGYGITDAASINTANAWTKGQNVQISSQTPAVGGTVTPDVQATNVYRILMPAGNITLANPINTTSGASGVAATLTIAIKQDAGGSRTISYGTKYKFPGGTVYQPDPTASALSLIYCQYEPNDDVWCVTSGSKFA